MTTTVKHTGTIGVRTVGFICIMISTAWFYPKYGGQSNLILLISNLKMQGLTKELLDDHSLLNVVQL